MDNAVGAGVMGSVVIEAREVIVQQPRRPDATDLRLVHGPGLCPVVLQIGGIQPCRLMMGPNLFVPVHFRCG